MHAESVKQPEKDRTIDKRQSGLSNLLEFPTFNLSNFFSSGSDKGSNGVHLSVPRTFARKVGSNRVLPTSFFFVSLPTTSNN